MTAMANFDEKYLKDLKEGYQIEFKSGERKVPLSFYETYCAFANTEGGTIYLGIKEGKPNVLVGVENPEEQVKAILSTLENKEKVSCNVLSSSDCNILSIDGKKIIEIKVREAGRTEKPVHLNGSYSFSYKRVGDGDRRLTEPEIHSKLIDRDPYGVDLLPSNYRIGVEDLDSNTIAEYRKRFIPYHKDGDLSSLSNQEFLQRIGCYRKGDKGELLLSNAAILFFGKWQDIIAIYPHYLLDYQYHDRSLNERWKRRISSDDLTWPGNIFSFFLRVEEAIAPLLPNPFKREYDNNYDGRDILEACLEALVNALSNASYGLPGAVLVNQGRNYIEISNPGDMIVDQEQAIAGGVSMPRNPSILTFFRLIGVAEKTGFGVPKVFSVASRYGFPTPAFSVRNDIERTKLRLSFITLPSDTPSRDLKMRIISYLSQHEDGIDGLSLAEGISAGATQVSIAVRELILEGIVTTNNKVKKGRRLFLNDDYNF